MTVYVDILFFINFSMDFLALFLVGMISHKKIIKPRIIVSSGMGGFFGVLAIVIEMSTAMKAISAIVVAFMMCLICYGAGTLPNFVVSTTLYLFISMSLGGIMSVIYSVCSKILSNIIVSEEYGGAFGSARSMIIMGLTAIFATVFTKILINKKEVITAKLEVTVSGKTYFLSGLCDSGNLLTEPFSGKRVILVSCESALGKEIEKIDDIKKRYIPYKDVNGSGVLKGIFAEKITVNNKSVDALLATANNKSFNGNDALIPNAII